MMQTYSYLFLNHQLAYLFQRPKELKPHHSQPKFSNLAFQEYDSGYTNTFVYKYDENGKNPQVSGMTRERLYQFSMRRFYAGAYESLYPYGGSWGIGLGTNPKSRKKILTAKQVEAAAPSVVCSAAAMLVARVSTFRIEHEETFDLLRWLDR